MNLSKIKNKLFDKQDLSFEESSFVFKLIMNGEVGEIDTASILISLKIKNERFVHIWLFRLPVTSECGHFDIQGRTSTCW